MTIQRQTFFGNGGASRGVAMALAAMAAFDWLFLHGKYGHAVEAAAHFLAHHLVG
jgi:shikimate 5-dehydrogenase